MAQAKMDFVINTKVDKTAFVELKREIQALQNLTEKDLVNFGSAGSFQEAKQQLAAIQNSATIVETALNKAFSPKLGTVSLSKFNKELKNINLQQLADNFSKAGASGTAAFRTLTTNVLTTKVHIKETHKLLDDMGKTMTNTIKWGLSSSAWNTMTGSFQKAYGYIKDLDKSLNNIRIVSGKTADEMARFAQQANNAAKTLGTRTTDYTDAALIYYQQGLNEDEVIKRTDATVKMANVLGASAEEVSNYMTAIWNNFDDGSKSIEYYADVLAKLGAATASSAEEISTGLEKFAAIADTVGLSYEYATAALTTVTATTRQSADVVGTAFKTLFARIQDLELGETLEDGVTLGKYSEALSAIGVNVIDASGNLKDMNSILDDMGSKWDSLTDAQKVSLAQTVAGTRQYTQLIALMDNWDMFEENVNMAASATGELSKQQDIYLESTQAHLDKLSASAERLYKSLIDSDGLNDLIDIFSGLVTGVTEYTEAIGGSQSVLLQLGNLATKAFGRTVSQGIATSISNIKKLKEEAKDFNAQAEIIQKFKGIKVDDKAFDQLVKMAQVVNQYKDTLSEAQVEQANALMHGYKDAVNAQEEWKAAADYARNYYQFITKEQAGSLDHSFSGEQLESYFSKLDEKIAVYAQKIGASKKEIETVIADRSKSEIDAYINATLEMIDNKLIKNEQIETKLKGIIDKYTKATALEDKNKLSEEEAKALVDFGELYGKVSDDMIKDTERVKKIFAEAHKGAAKTFKTAVDESTDNWRGFVDTVDTQAFAQYFIDMSGQIMSVASAMQSLHNLPSIWNNDDLTTGEKILQTMIAIGNVGQGLVTTYQLIHGTAELIRKVRAKSAIDEIAQGKIIENTTKKQLEEAVAVHRTVKERKSESEEIDTAESEVKDKTAAIEEEQVVSRAASEEEINDEIRYANQVALSAATIHKKSDALRQKTTGRKSKAAKEAEQMYYDSYDLILQENRKSLIEEHLREKGYVGTFKELPSMQKERLSTLMDDKTAEEFSTLFKSLYGQGRGIAASGGSIADFHVKDEDVEKRMISFLNLWAGSKDYRAAELEQRARQNEKKPDAKELVDNLDKVTKKTDEAEEALKNLGNGDNGKKGKGIFDSLKGDLKTIWSVVAAIPAPAWIAAGALAAVGVAIWAMHEAAVKEQKQIENLRTAASEMQKDYEELTATINEVKSDFDDYNSVLTTLHGCTEGTKEWQDALQQVNNSALEILKKYPELAKTEGLFTRINGVLQVNQDVLDTYLDKKQKEADVMQISSMFATGYADELQAKKDKKDLRSTLKTEFEADARAASTKGNNGRNPGTVTDQQASDISSVLNFLEDNYDKLAGLTKEEYEQKLREMGIEDGLIDEMLKYQTKIDDLVKNTDDAAVQMNNLAKYVANIITGGTDSSTSETSNILAQEDFKNKSSEEYNKLLKKYTGSGISKASGKNNEIYQEMIKDLSKVEGFEGITIAKNGVRGTDNNRTFVYKKDGVEYERTAEEIASIIANSKATEGMESADYYDAEAKKKLSGITNILGDEGTADRLIGAITSKDYSQLTEDDFNLISANQDKLKNALSNEDAEALGLENGEAFNKGLETAINEWDPFEAKETLENKMNQLYAAAAQATGATEDEVRIMVDGMQENLEGLDTDATEEDLIELAKTTLKFQKNLKKLGSVLEDNKDDLKKWKDSTESAADLGLTESVGELATAVKDLFGFENVDEDFLKENFDLITQAANGSEAALDQLEIKAGKEFILNLKVEGIEDIYNQYNDVFETLANTDLDIGVNFDDEQALTDLQKFFDTAKLSQADAQKVLNEYGYEGDLEEIKPPKQTRVKQVVEEQIDYTPISSPPQTFGVADGNGEFRTVTMPGQTLQAATRTTVTKDVSEEYQPPSYWVLKSKDSTGTSSSPASSTTYTGLSGSVRSTGAGKQRAASVKSGLGKPSGGGSKSKPRKEDKLEEKKDRYHDINIELKQIENELQKVQDEQENLVGSDLIANLQRQYNLLNKEIDATARKIGIAKGEQDELQAKLAGNGVNFNKDGTIANYAQAWDAQLAYVNSIIDKYNSMSAEAQENYQETLDNAKEQWNEFKENISRYDTLITEDIPGLEADIRNALDQQIEIKLEAFEYEIQIRLDMSEAMRDWNEFKAKIIDGIKEDDILGNAKAKLANFHSYYNKEGTGEIQATTKHVDNIMAQLKQMDADQAAGVYGETYTYTNAQGKEVTVDYNNRKQALEDLKEYYSQLMDSMMSLQELQEEIHQSYLDMMDEAQEKFDEQLSTYQTIDEIIQHDMNLVQLMYGDSASLAKYYKEQRKNLDNQLDFQKQQVAFWRNQMDTLEQGSEEWEKAKENWIAAGNEWRSLAETNLQVITDEYTDAINTIFENLNNSVTNGMGLSYVSKEWELINQNADRYLDQVNAIYETQTLQNKYLDAIENSTNPAQQKKLNDLMQEEINLLKEKDKLSQYDLDRANLKYEIAMKQMALEESQQKKTQLRLRRDSQGNYSYQYTNDESEVSKLQQELSDLYNQLYNLDAGQYKSNLDELYSVWDAFQQDMYEASLINDPEERKKREEMLEREYGELINGIIADNESIKQNLQQSTMSQLLDLYDQNEENYNQMTDSQRAILDNFISEEADYTGAAFDNLFGLYNENLVAFDNMTNDQINTLMNDFIPQWNSGVQQMADSIIGEGGFAQVTKSAIEEIRALALVWDEERTAAYNEAIAASAELQKQTEELAKDNTTLIETYGKELEAVKEVIKELETLISTYGTAEEAAKKAAQAAYEYWQAANNENAKTDTNIKTDQDKKNTEGPKADVKKENTNTQTNSLGYASNGAPFIATYTVKSGDTLSGIASRYGINWNRIYAENRGVIGGNPNLIQPGQTYKIPKYATGGYTGDWAGNGGQLAMLHKKELVLNSSDTKNILNAVEILRSITSALGHTLMNQMSTISAGNTSSIANAIGTDTLEQMVHIDAQFPNVKDSQEIENALNNLVNMASQHIQKK